MCSQEMAANNVSTLPDVCAEHNIRWLCLPIIDDQAPSKAFERQWHKHQQSLLDELNNQGVVAVHCKGGTGRTGTVISLLLLALGWPLAKIIKEVQIIKPKALQIPVQLDYLAGQTIC
jgi:protein-tyrosine phosphatase